MARYRLCARASVGVGDVHDASRDIAILYRSLPSVGSRCIALVGLRPPEQELRENILRVLVQVILTLVSQALHLFCQGSGVYDRFASSR